MKLNAKWAARWKAVPPIKAPTKGPYYQLCMFPYPSGKLHIGHLRVYTISDVLARYRRLQGYDVIHPFGWDAFGLPAENAAREHGIDPAEWTYTNIKAMREQLQQMLPSFDWDREVVTCDPEYYSHTQRLFLEMFKAGLAYRAKSAVNWDPVDETVLANEQVDSQGKSWRSGAMVEKRDLDQWFLRITEYAERLSTDLELLTQWPEQVKTMQRNWIGLSHGAEIRFGDDLWVFTTRPETLGAACYVAISLEHPLAVANVPNSFRSRDIHSPDSKDGWLIDSVKAVNPLTGAELPVYAAPYVLSGYGSGAVMGVPAHDQRDFAFWRTNAHSSDVPAVVNNIELPYTGKDLPLNERSQFPGLTCDEGAAAIVQKLEKTGDARYKQTMRLRDWLISRQRKWGAPIPIVHCHNCGTVPFEESQLPVTPDAPSKTTCPQCGNPDAWRDPDTMDTFMDSSWYFFRYTDPQNMVEPWDSRVANQWLPVNMYVGGVEHAILHLLYARFLSKFAADAGLWNGGDLRGEPFRRLVTQGMVHGKTHIDPDTGRFLKNEEVGPGGVIKATGKVALISHEKMSKSKHNGVDPTAVIEAHGADATRAHILFSAPVSDVLDWDSDKIVGVERWLGRLETLTRADFSVVRQASKADVSVWNSEVVAALASITDSLERTLGLNTVVSDLMKLTRAVASLRGTPLGENALRALIVAVSPVCPCIAEECWEIIDQRQNNQRGTSVFVEQWPQLEQLTESTAGVEFAVLVNGRRVGVVEANADIAEADIIEKVKANSPPQLRGDITRVIFKPQKRLLSLVCK